MRIAIGCDDASCHLKAEIMEHIKKCHQEIEIEDFGIHEGETTMYPDIAWKVAQAVADHKFDRGILMCGTGIGMSICANKVPGIRAAVCHDPFSAQRARKSNNAQILCMGERVVGTELAKCLVDIWLKCDFAGGNSEKKVERICELEKSSVRV